MLFLKLKNLNNLVHIVVGLILSKSTLLSDIASELGNSFCEGKEDSKIKKIFRFFSNKNIDSEFVYQIFTEKIIKNYRPKIKDLILIFDHTTIEDKFLILQFSMKAGNRNIPLLYKMFYYKEENNKGLKYVKEGLLTLYTILKPYNYKVIVLGDRGFKSTDLFSFIENKLNWSYCIRCTKSVSVKINGGRCKLSEIKVYASRNKHFNNVQLTQKNFICNLSVCKSSESEDIWYLIHNFKSRNAVTEYKKRFTIEEMFRDFKKGGFNLESTWSKDLTYAKNLYLAVCIAYTWVIALGKLCTKQKKNTLLGSVKYIKNKRVRIYSIFRTGLKWLKRCMKHANQILLLNFSFAFYGD
jgi:hypothetical protein